MESDLILHLEGGSKLLPGTMARDDVSLTVRRGEAHAVCGENGAGKSTMMNIIAGVFPPTSGKLFFEGEEVSFANPLDAIEKGIALVHQEISLCPHVSVAENIFMGRLPHTWLGTIDHRRLHADCTRIIESFCGAGIDSRDKVGNLNIAQQQMVEIMKALSLNCKLLILDEPTSSLTDRETECLFELLHSLLDRGLSIMYISHRLSEISKLCHRVTVLRDGCYIATKELGEVTTDDIITMMVGRTLHSVYPPKAEKIGEEFFRVEHMTVPGVVDDVGFSLRKGEILGLCGLIGAGRTELARALCGIDGRKTGDVYLDGKKLRIDTYGDAIRAGLAYLTEDRKLDGLFLNESIQRNISSARLDAITRGILLGRGKEAEIARRYVDSVRIKVASIKQLCSTLSGGNQQKVLLAKWLLTEPKVFIIDEPTRGIDVGVKLEVYKILRSLAEQGVGVIVITSDLPEAIGICDRVLVMRTGAFSGEMEGDAINETNFMRYASHA